MLALIPARGGSKGLPGKNTKKLHNKPLIAYSIEAALAAKAVSRVLVSTDDKDIARIALEYGAEVPFMRPDFLASDEAKAADTFLYTLDELQRQEDYTANEIMILQPTSPLRQAWHIDEAAALYQEKNADSVASFCAEQHPIKWHKYLDSDGRISEVFPEVAIQNRQQEQPTYYPNGAIYIFKSVLLKQSVYYTKNSYAYIMAPQYSVDIDTEDDFEYANYLLIKNLK